MSDILPSPQGKTELQMQAAPLQHTLLQYAPRWLSLIGGAVLLDNGIYQALTNPSSLAAIEGSIGAAIALFVYSSTGKPYGN